MPLLIHGRKCHCYIRACIHTYLPACLPTYIHRFGWAFLEEGAAAAVLAAVRFGLGGIALGALWIAIPSLTPAPKWLQRLIRCPLRATSIVLARRSHNGEQSPVQSEWPPMVPTKHPTM